MAAAAGRGYAYYAVTDHAPNLIMQRMTDEKMLAQRERVRALDRHGTRDAAAARHRAQHRPGRRRWTGPTDFLAGFDLCVASVHSHFEPVPGRDDPAVRRGPARTRTSTSSAIPTTRLIGKRPAGGRRLGRGVRAACARTGTALEINASRPAGPAGRAHPAGQASTASKFAIDSDAHSVVRPGAHARTASARRSAAG